MSSDTAISLGEDHSLQDFFRKEDIFYESNFPLSKLSFMKVGGISRYLVFPDSEQKFLKIVRHVLSVGRPFLVIGQLSNTIFRDGVIETVLISTSRLNSHSFCENGEYRAEAGVSLPEMARRLSDAAYIGFSGLIGIPASIGGAVYMNAGCFGNEIANYLVRVRCIDKSGQIVEFDKEELGFSWRHSAFHHHLKGYVILEAFFAPEQGCLVQIQTHMAECKASRSSFQEHSFPNLGSIFATRDIYAALAHRFWRYRFGCFLIRLKVRFYSENRLKLALRLFNEYTQHFFNIPSNEHAGFSECTFNCIINKGGANASEMIAFIRDIEKRIKHCIPLEIEILDNIT